MRILLGLSAVALLTLSASAAPAQGLPPGSYRNQCRDISMNGPFLTATCGGVRGGGQSSINVQSCAGDIGVDATGALSCQGPGGGRPNPGPNYPGGPGPGPGPGPGGPGYPGGPGRPPGPGYDRDSITVYSKKNFQGRAQRIDGPVGNLANMGLNDQIRSIQLGRRSGSWIVCADANFRGRCDRVDRDIADTRRIGMDRSISSLRPGR